MKHGALFDSNGRKVELGRLLGSGAAANVYSHLTQKNTAVKLFNPQHLSKEHNLSARLDKLHKLGQVSDFAVRFGDETRTLGSFPKDVVADSSRRIIGYTMDTIENGFSMNEIIFARTPGTAFYSLRKRPDYDLLMDTFLYKASSLRNRLILCYYLAHAFDRMYYVRTKTGQRLDVEICNFDIKPMNILVSIQKQNDRSIIVPYLLDLDNLTISNKTGKVAPVHPQFTPEYRAPEGPIDRYYDYFSIAVMFYQLILNTHPFNVLGGTRFTDGTEMQFFVRNMCFAWGRRRKFLGQQTQNDKSHANFKKLPASMQQLFIRSFDSDQPSGRTPMSEWIGSFQELLQDRTTDFKRLFNIT
jgi:serine/threonine protein kinase